MGLTDINIVLRFRENYGSSQGGFKTEILFALTFIKVEGSFLCLGSSVLYNSYRKTADESDLPSASRAVTSYSTIFHSIIPLCNTAKY